MSHIIIYAEIGGTGRQKTIMKKQFANPELKIVMLDNADIIATSGGNGTGATGDDIPMSARFRDLEDED